MTEYRSWLCSDPDDDDEVDEDPDEKESSCDLIRFDRSKNHIFREEGVTKSKMDYYHPLSNIGLLSNTLEVRNQSLAADIMPGLAAEEEEVEPAGLSLAMVCCEDRMVAAEGETEAEITKLRISRNLCEISEMASSRS